MQYTEEAIKKRIEKSEKRRDIFRRIVYLLLLPLFIYNCSLIIQAIIKPNETPNFLGYKTYVIISGSMQPELDIGDIVIVKKVDTDTLKEDDIISFRRGQRVITHRISRIVTEDGVKKFVTKGDNNNTEDVEKVKIENVEGIVVNTIRGAGNIVLILKDKVVIITIVVIYYIFLIHDQSMQRKKMIRRIKREEHENERMKEESK